MLSYSEMPGGKDVVNPGMFPARYITFIILYISSLVKFAGFRAKFLSFEALRSSGLDFFVSAKEEVVRGRSGLPPGWRTEGHGRLRRYVDPSGRSYRSLADARRVHGPNDRSCLRELF